MRGISRFGLLDCLVCALVMFCGTSGSIRAQAPASLQERIRGNWEMLNPPKGRLFATTVRVEFTATEMKVITKITKIEDKKREQEAPSKNDIPSEVKDEATYRINERQRKLEMTFKRPSGDKVTKTETIETLNNERLVTVNEKGQKTEYKKLR